MVVTRKLNKVKGDRDIEEALTKTLIDFYHRRGIDILWETNILFASCFQGGLGLWLGGFFMIHVMKRTKRQKVTSLQTKWGLI